MSKKVHWIYGSMQRLSDDRILEIIKEMEENELDFYEAGDVIIRESPFTREDDDERYWEVIRVSIRGFVKRSTKEATSTNLFDLKEVNG